MIDTEDYENDPVLSELATAIEAIICVDFQEIMRPESPYPLEEGCIDCHILAMNDILSKVLEKNVAPQQNSMMAWGTSNRWGPTIAFNLNVLIGKAKPYIAPPKYSDYSPQELTDLYIEKLKQDTTHQLDPIKKQDKATVVTMLSAMGILEGERAADEKQKKGFYRGLKNYRVVTEAETVGQQFHNDIVGLLEQWRESFERLQDKYIGLAIATKFHEKDKCSF